MSLEYPNVITRFLRADERLIQSEEQHMPLVIEATTHKSLSFLQTLLTTYAQSILQQVAEYGAVLFRGFEIASDQDFEQALLAIPEFNAISEAFMAEEGRVHVDNSNYVLHTNAVYKTGGTVYLGGFHGENYYNPDVPTYISFCCFKPSELGGETGLINTAKVYQHLDHSLKQKLEEKACFVAKWRLQEAAERYHLSTDQVKSICQRFNLPIEGVAPDEFILMYKPNVFQHPITQEKALQINLLELDRLNDELRECFLADYQGKHWFWHRFFWKVPHAVFNLLSFFYIVIHSFAYSPRESLTIAVNKLKTKQAERQPLINDMTKVGRCFDEQNTKQLAQLMRQFYCSCLWQKGDILLIDNRKVMHAGMPGKGSRLVRAMIGNPLDVPYQSSASGVFNCQPRTEETVGFYMSEQLKGEQPLVSGGELKGNTG